MGYSGYQPSDWGKRYHSLTENEALGAGAAGPGKSYILFHEPLVYIKLEHMRCELPQTHPNYIEPGKSTCHILYLRRTYPMVRQAFLKMKEIYEYVDPGVVWSEKNGWFLFTSGLKVQLGHCHKPDDWMQYYSDEFQLIMFDELTQFNEEQYDQICTRLRSSDPLLMRMCKVRSMSNPVTVSSEMGGDVLLKDPHWVRKRFVDPWPDGGRTIKTELRMLDGSKEYVTRIYLPAKLSDNPNKEFVRTYEIKLQASKPHLRRALLLGDWYVIKGAFYEDCWNPNVHVIAPFVIPPEWRRFRSLDWGYKKHGVVGWWAIDPDGNLYLEREVTFRLQDATYVAKEIVRLVEQQLGLWSTEADEGGRSLISGPADTQLWEERGGSGRTMAEEMAAEGVSWLKADKKYRKRNALRLAARLSSHENGTSTIGGIFFFNSCEMTIKTIPAIQTKKDDLETPLDGGEDHWHDMVLYGTAYASRPGAGFIPANDNDDGLDDDDIPVPNKKWGRYGYGSAA